MILLVWLIKPGLKCPMTFLAQKSQSIPYSSRQKQCQAYLSNTPFQEPASILVRVSIAVKRYHDHGNSYVGKDLIVPGLQFRGLVHYRCAENHSGTWTDTVLER